MADGLRKEMFEEDRSDKRSPLHEKWERESAEKPRMAKSTFVTNELWNHGLEDVVDFIYESPDLHGAVHEITLVGGRGGASTPHPEKPGWFIWKPSEDQRQVIKIQVEIADAGESVLLGEHREREWSCDY